MSSHHRVTHVMRRPVFLARVWYRRLGIDPPALQAPRPLTFNLARLVPYRLRGFHHWYATRSGLFWLPCVLCDRPFGGHEIGTSIPDPTMDDERYWQGICSRCTKRRGRREDRERG